MAITDTIEGDPHPIDDTFDPPPPTPKSIFPRSIHHSLLIPVRREYGSITKSRVGRRRKSSGMKIAEGWRSKYFLAAGGWCCMYT
ncbi:hypothetical protein CEXT_388801 [Caerostris extrusa]|uniref:Uncharacterized protein n=1 Tax=Caerostris extrusa TaxID=172846 RepID=A0AAV4YGI8_CAEEX|nr:hypothetical protein CEXT_388801 [Caerostris extrusa]